VSRLPDTATKPERPRPISGGSFGFFFQPQINNECGTTAALLRAMEPDLKNCFQVGLHCLKKWSDRWRNRTHQRGCRLGKKSSFGPQTPIKRREEQNNG